MGPSVGTAAIRERMSKTHVMLLGSLLAIGACKSDTKVQPTAEAALAAAPSPKAQAPVAPATKAQPLWFTGGVRLGVDIVPVAGAHVVRVTAPDGKTFDVYTGGENTTTGDRNGALIIQDKKLATRAEQGSLYARTALLLTWDVAQHKPVEADKWSCDETSAATCKYPAWLGGEDTSAEITNEEARAVARQFLEAGLQADAKALAKLMPKNLVIGGGTDVNNPKTCAPAPGEPGGPDWDSTRSRAGACMAGLLPLTKLGSLADLTVEPQGETSGFTLPTPSPSRVLRIQRESEGLYIEVVVNRAAGKVLVTGAHVEMWRPSSDVDS
jgi:hypothetical protein